MKKYGDRGLKCAFIGDSEDQEEGIMKGRYQIVDASPEALLRATQWREMLKSCVYHDHLIGLVVDKAHFGEEIVHACMHRVIFRGGLYFSVCMPLPQLTRLCTYQLYPPLPPVGGGWGLGGDLTRSLI